MTPFLGAGAGQVIEVSLRILQFRLREIGIDRQTYDLGRFYSGFTSLKRACNEDHGTSGLRCLGFTPVSANLSSQKSQDVRA
jgi:hypothetical protein